MGTLRSFRGATAAELIRFGAHAATLGAEVEREGLHRTLAVTLATRS